MKQIFMVLVVLGLHTTAFGMPSETRGCVFGPDENTKVLRSILDYEQIYHQSVTAREAMTEFIKKNYPEDQQLSLTELIICGSTSAKRAEFLNQFLQE